MVKIFVRLINFLFPPVCPLCDTPVSVHGELCADCWSNFAWIDDCKCAKCGYPFSTEMSVSGDVLCPVCVSGQCELDWIRSACVYDDVSRSAMLPFKHGCRVQYANFMSRAMIWALRDINVDVDVVMPVPLANRRLFKRGYNQATLLARPIAKVLGMGVGISSGANLLSALYVQEKFGKQNVVTVFADDNKKYLSTDYSKVEPVKEGFISSDVELINFEAVR